MRNKNCLTALCLMIVMTGATWTACNGGAQDESKESLSSVESTVISSSQEESSKESSSKESASQEETSSVESSEESSLEESSSVESSIEESSSEEESGSEESTAQESSSEEDSVDSSSEEERKYKVTFVDEQGTVLQESELVEGDMPEFNGELPVLPSNTAEYTYTGAWDKEIVSVSGETTYTWIVTATKNKYPVSFDGENTVDCEYGATVTPPAIKQ